MAGTSPDKPGHDDIVQRLPDSKSSSGYADLSWRAHCGRRLGVGAPSLGKNQPLVRQLGILIFDETGPSISDYLAVCCMRAIFFVSRFISRIQSRCYAASMSARPERVDQHLHLYLQAAARNATLLTRRVSGRMPSECAEDHIAQDISERFNLKDAPDTATAPCSSATGGVRRQSGGLRFEAITGDGLKVTDTGTGAFDCAMTVRCSSGRKDVDGRGQGPAMSRY
jgi:hypothetical protein